MAVWGRTTRFKLLGGEIQMTNPGEAIASTRLKLENLRTKAMNLMPVFAACKPVMFWNEQQVFAAQGLPTPWAQLSRPYADWKAQNFPGQTILRRTDRLFASLTSGTGETIFDVGPRSLRFGTNTPSAAFHATGTGKMPARPPVYLTPEAFAAVYDAAALWLEDWDTFTPPRASV